MAPSKSTGYAAAVAVLVLSVASTARGQEVTFSQIRDAVPLQFFESAETRPSTLNPNNLIIGFDSGFGPPTWRATDFRASTLPFSQRSATDTIAFLVEAPSGYYISKITYTQRGIGFTNRTAVEAGTSNWVVAGFPSNLGSFTSNPNLSGTADLSELKLTSVPVAITSSLFAAATGSVAITSADVLVEVLPQPVVEPAVVEPAVVEPAAVEPAAVEPAVVQPAVVEPAVVQPAVVEPAVVQPAAVEPAVVQPAAVVEPAVVQPE
jgi:hypothetical protein